MRQFTVEEQFAALRTEIAELREALNESRVAIKDLRRRLEPIERGRDVFADRPPMPAPKFPKILRRAGYLPPSEQ